MRGLKNGEEKLRGSGGKAPRKIFLTTPSNFVIDVTNALFVPRNATEGLQMCYSSISYLNVPQKYSKIVVNMNVFIK